MYTEESKKGYGWIGVQQTNKQTNSQNTRYMIFVCLCLHKEKERKRKRERLKKGNTLIIKRIEY